jgi:hypothetical protein
MFMLKGMGMGFVELDQKLVEGMCLLQGFGKAWVDGALAF